MKNNKVHFNNDSYMAIIGGQDSRMKLAATPKLFELQHDCLNELLGSLFNIDNVYDKAQIRRELMSVIDVNESDLELKKSFNELVIAYLVDYGAVSNVATISLEEIKAKLSTIVGL